MSVRDVSKEELQELYQRLLDEPGLLQTFGMVSEKSVAEALLSVYAANKAAQFLTYGDFQSFERFDVTAGKTAVKLTAEGLFEALGNLIYNCISNGGKCFLPTEQENLIMNLRFGLARKAFAGTGGRA